jgi:zinc/manganese transport system substrate-binding protein
VKSRITAFRRPARRIITSHGAFGYFGLELMAPEGVSTDSKASAQAVANFTR